MKKFWDVHWLFITAMLITLTFICGFILIERSNNITFDRQTVLIQALEQHAARSDSLMLSCSDLNRKMAIATVWLIDNYNEIPSDSLAMLRQIYFDVIQLPRVTP
jgi:hypothetical protein